MYQFVSSEIKEIHFDFATSTDHEEEERLLTERYKYCRTVPGTRSLYCIIPITNTSVEVRQFSLSEVKRIGMLSSGPSYGYFVNPGKTWLIVKPQHERDAKELFSGTGIGITSEGKRHLGAALGSRSFLESYISDKV